MSDTDERGIKRLYRAILNNIGWIILIFCLIVFSLTVEGFFSVRNYTNLLRNSVFIGLLAIAECYCLISGNLDLSIESVAAFTSVVSAWLCGFSDSASGLHLNPYLSLLICISIGAIIGFINGFFVVKLKINAFLVTLSTFISVRGLAVYLCKGHGISRLPDSYRFIETSDFFGIPIVIFIMIAFYIFFHFLLENTRFGRHIYVIGGNVKAAYNFGIDVDGIIFRVFILSGSLSGIAGWLLTARANGASPGIASGFLFEVIAAVVIGGVALTGGVGTIVGVFAGVLLLTAIHSALNMSNISPFVTQIIRGLLVLAAISLDSMKRLFK